MRVLTLWADDRSSNLGVRALARGSAALAEQAFPGVEVVHLAWGQGPAPVGVGDWRRVVKDRVSRPSKLQEWLGGFDLAIDTRAGDSFADIYGMKRLRTQSLLADLTTQAGVPVVLGPQTIGPFGAREARTLARWSMRRAAAVMARDSVSAAYADGLGRPVDVLSTDVVFALPQPAAGAAPERDVLLNVSGLLWAPNNHVDHEQYRAHVLTVARGLLADGRRVGLLAHVLDSHVADNDVPAVHEVAALLDSPEVEVVVPTDLDDVRAVVGAARLVIGSRMHACLNALSTGTAALPLAYSRKFDPLLRDLGWRHNVDLRTAEDPAGAVLRLVSADLDDEVRATQARAAELLAPAVAALQRVA
ncbi:polysaccharide pyruvyl transferase family protein [Cellulomonas endophytica]|uniref:polysaccharide pyruvyl transferase family protein n=1 Tax=Cellulomonas endophytica TaxID=2494735 RepID=UPI0013E91C59|nr:polysaccharide pyruvyl transferase family protein [Cellulomonas endophytica]